MDLVAIRNRLDLTQAALAAKLGVSPGLIGDIERGHRRLSLKNAARLAELAGDPAILDEAVAAKIRAA